MGDKVTARRTMERMGVGGVPGSQGLVIDKEEALRVAGVVGYPILLKATAGGGGKGMRVCGGPRELPDAFADAQMEAEAAFGESGIFIEKFVHGGRHIEFQILGDNYGHVVHLGERECSTQRSNQKLVEECPSPCVTAELRAEAGGSLASVLSTLGYVGAGTVEFLRAPTGELYFLEMNTRLQVEHPVTELVTGEDLVAWQIRLAAGQRLALRQEDVVLKGHAIECRINAEDPDNDFRPSPGTVTGFRAPADWAYNLEGPVRLDTHVTSGYRIPTTSDSMIAKLVVWGDDRAASIARMKSALDTLEIAGIATTQELSSAIMNDPNFVSGDYDTARMAAMMARRASGRPKAAEPQP
jgi:acetyl-CoA carboxylase biotin carboxylase subunit